MNRDILYAEVYDEDENFLPTIVWHVEDDIREMSRPAIWRYAVRTRKRHALDRLLEYLCTSTGGAFETSREIQADAQGRPKPLRGADINVNRLRGKVLVLVQYEVPVDEEAWLDKVVGCLNGMCPHPGPRPEHGEIIVEGFVLPFKFPEGEDIKKLDGAR